MAIRRSFSRAVIERDKVCQECGAGPPLRAHRIKPPDSFPHLANDPANGRALCMVCVNKTYHRQRLHSKPTRATLEKRIAMLVQEVDDLRKLNELLRTKPGSLTPLDYALQTLNDTSADKADRQWAAATAMPFVHKRMPLAIENVTPHAAVCAAVSERLATLTPEQFLAVKLASEGIIKSIPTPAEVMASIAAGLLQEDIPDRDR